MKQIIITISICIIVIIFGVLESLYVSSTLNKLLSDISDLNADIVTNQDDITIFNDRIQSLKEDWIEDEAIICLVFNHKDLLPITESITRLAANINNNNYDDTIIELHLLEMYTINNSHTMGFNINNII